MKKWSHLEKDLFIAFLLWCMAGLTFLLLHISKGTIVAWSLPGWLKAFITFCLDTGDPILIILAFANTHLHAAQQWTPHFARRWGLIILICSFGVETLGAATGFPFGTYRYTHNFGPLLGLVPATIPLAWYVVVTNALFIVRRAIPHTSRWIEAGAAAFLCTLYDFILEPFATTVKRYWLWDHGAITAQNYVAWFILSGLLVGFFAPTASTRFPRDLRPVAILCLTLLIFLIGR